MGSHCLPLSLPLCSEEQGRVGDGSRRRTLSRDLTHPSSVLASSTSLCLQLNLQAPVSPPMLRWKLFSPSFLLILCSALFYPFFIEPVYPSVPLSPACASDGQMALPLGSGVRVFPYQQHAWDSSHCLACFLMTPWRLK